MTNGWSNKWLMRRYSLSFTSTTHRGGARKVGWWVGQVGVLCVLTSGDLCVLSSESSPDSGSGRERSANCLTTLAAGTRHLT